METDNEKKRKKDYSDAGILRNSKERKKRKEEREREKRKEEKKRKEKKRKEKKRKEKRREEKRREEKRREEKRKGPILLLTRENKGAALRNLDGSSMQSQEIRG